MIVQSRNYIPRILLLALVILIGATFFSVAETLPTGSDELGYVYAGERLSNHDGLTYEDPNNVLAGPYFSPFAFQIRRTDDARMFLGYPPGLPILLASGIKLTNQVEAIYFVIPFFAILGTLATFFLGKLIGGDEWVGLWAAFLVGLTSAYWTFGTAVWSEIPSVAFVTSGVYFYLLSQEPKGSKNQALIFSLLGGLLVSYSFFIRYSNVTILLAIGVYELITKRFAVFKEWYRWPFFALLGIGLMSMLVFNHFYYGGVLLTSYSPVHGWYPEPAFLLAYALGPSFVGGYSLVEAGKTLWLNFPGLLILAPFGWFLMKRPYGVLTAVAALGTLFLYAVYAFAATGINSRFILPAFPFLAIAIAYTLTSLSKKLPRSLVRVGGIILVIALLSPVPRRLESLQTRNDNNALRVARIQRITETTLPDSVFLSYSFNDQIIHYGQRSVLNSRRIPISDPEEGRYLWEMLEPCLIQTINKLLEADKSLYYVESKSWLDVSVFRILQDNYLLKPLSTAPILYSIVEPLNANYSSSCQQ